MKLTISVAAFTPMLPNGTAVEGVCVTGEASRFLVPVASSEVVPVASQYGAIFASPGERKKCHLCS
jgi:hypothetical protein